MYSNGTELNSTERLFMQTQTEKYPFDYDALKKGDVIAAESLEGILLIKRDDARFGLKILGLKEKIESELDARGHPVTVRIDKGSLVILTDEEAAVYNPEQFDLGVRKAGRAHRRTIAVDMNNLEDGNRKKLERRIEVQGRVLQAIRKERRVLSVEPHRVIPKIEVGTP